MSRVVTDGLLSAGEVELVLRARSGAVCETALPHRHDGDLLVASFSLAVGPYRHYSRKVEVRWQEDPRGIGARRGEARAEVYQEVDYQLDAPFWNWFLAGPIRSQLKRLVPRQRKAWWLPPDTLDPRSLRMLCVLSLLALVSGFQNALMPQTLTYAAKTFHATNLAQSVVLSASRVDALFALAMMVVADRIGRRNVLLQTIFWGGLVSALGALAPNLFWFGAAQTIARSLVAAQVALIAIYAAEEMPAGSRAYALGILTAVGVLGAGINVVLLSGVNVYGWRAIFGLALAGSVIVPFTAHLLPESKRFVRRHVSGPSPGTTRPTLRNHLERLMLLVALGFLIQIFAQPTSQFLNQFLRTERGYSAPHITLYNIFTTIPGAIGLFGGGRLADRYGRKVVAAFSIVVGSCAMVAGYLSWGWQMWFFHMVAQILAGALIPAITILGPEIFPTALRGAASGVYTISQSAGAVSGFLLVGLLSGASKFGDLGVPIALMAVGPFAMTVVLAKWFPETAHRELEDINPEDVAPQETSPETPPDLPDGTD